MCILHLLTRNAMSNEMIRGRRSNVRFVNESFDIILQRLIWTIRKRYK